jgi:site-specific recombinase XerD
MKNEKQNFGYAVSRFFKVYLPGERGFSENTISSYRDTFKQFILYCMETARIPPEKLVISDFSRELITGFLSKLEADGKSVSTRNQRLAALKSFFGYIKFLVSHKF